MESKENKSACMGLSSRMCVVVLFPKDNDSLSAQQKDLGRTHWGALISPCVVIETSVKRRAGKQWSGQRKRWRTASLDPFPILLTDAESQTSESAYQLIFLRDGTNPTESVRVVASCSCNLSGGEERSLWTAKVHGSRGELETPYEPM